MRLFYWKGSILELPAVDLTRTLLGFQIEVASLAYASVFWSEVLRIQASVGFTCCDIVKTTVCAKVDL